MVDVSELELAMVNIAVNARDAMPGGGRLTLKARNVELDLRSPLGLSGEFVVLEFADTGTGIPAANMSKIFEPFFTTKEVGKGTGLGLSQVYGFARQSGGDVTVSSREGEGTIVSLYLPRSTATSRAVDASPAKIDGSAGGGTILLVEDNPQVAEVTKLLLEQLGYRVAIADAPDQVFDILRREPAVRLVFSDIVMPGASDGLALAADLRQRHPALPILLVTGYSSAAERAGTQFQILRKPYDLAALSAAVKSALQAEPAAAAAQ
jgi:two-component system NtrC family sensor kinase